MNVGISINIDKKQFVDLVMFTIEKGYFYSFIYHNWSVVWNMNFTTFHSVGNVIIQLTFFFFSEGLKPPTRYIVSSTHKP